MRNILRFERDQWSGVAIATVVLLVFSVLFGGASRQHELRLALVELAAIPLLALSLISAIRSGDWRHYVLPLGIVAAACAIPLVQLIPLPPGIWTNLPGHQPLVQALSIAGIPVGWTPLSLTPDRTWRSFLALLPPIAMFFGALATTGPSRLRLVHLLLAGVVFSIFLGAAQLASGGDALYPWRTTSAGSVVGFFANRNHLATLCVVAVPFAAVLGARVMRRRTDDQAPVWLSAIFLALVIVALGVIRSRAGVLLIGPVLAFTLVATWVAAGRGRPKPLLLVVISATTLATLAVALFAVGPLLQRFDTPGAREGRFENWPIVAQAAENYLPLGSGIGSFDAVYRSVEPLERLDPTFFNQAHNDYLETWLEAGWLGAAALLAFLVWYVRRTWSAWRAKPSTDRDLQRAASISIGAILLHSAADYPLRTATMATIFALCCGLLELASRSDEELRRQWSRRDQS